MSAEIYSLRLKIAELFDKWNRKVNDFLARKMFLRQWMKIALIWLMVWVVLASVSSAFKSVLWVSCGLLSVHVAHWIYQAVQTAAPKTLIKSTSGKAVVITGCDTGFGHQAAVRLHELGFKVFAGCLYPEGEGAKALRMKSSDAIRILKIDVTDDKTIKTAFQIVKKELEQSKDRLWALVNNAGIAAVIEIEWCPIDLYRKVFDVNALGPVRVTKTFLPLIRQNEGSRIVFVTSLAGRYTTPGFSAYSMSKHAAASFADGLRLEMRKWKVTVHTVEPTLYKTPIADISQISDTVDRMWEECPSDVKKSYGVEYLQDFKDTLRDRLQRAKPSEKIHEVIDDMVHSVAGEEPKCRYVPSLKTQLHDHILSSLPMEVLDKILSQAQPRTPPADVEGLKKSRFQF